MASKRLNVAFGFAASPCESVSVPDIIERASSWVPVSQAWCCSDRLPMALSAWVNWALGKLDAEGNAGGGDRATYERGMQRMTGAAAAPKSERMCAGYVGCLEGRVLAMVGVWA